MRKLSLHGMVHMLKNMNTTKQAQDKAHAFFNSNNEAQCIIFLLEKVFDIEERLSKLGSNVFQMQHRYD